MTAPHDGIKASVGQVLQSRGDKVLSKSSSERVCTSGASRASSRAPTDFLLFLLPRFADELIPRRVNRRPVPMENRRDAQRRVIKTHTTQEETRDSLEWNLIVTWRSARAVSAWKRHYYKSTPDGAWDVRCIVSDVI